MASPETIEWAKSQLKESFTPDELKSVMLEFGYSEQEAREVIAAAAAPKQAPAHPAPKPQQKPQPKPTPSERLAIKDSPGEEAVHYAVDYSEKASRLELFIRVLYLIPVGIVLSILSFLLALVLPLEWLHTLILGKRNRALNDVILKYSMYFTRANTYGLLLTDQRPPVFRGVGKLLLVAVALYAAFLAAMVVLALYVVLPQLAAMGIGLPAGV